MKNFTHFLIVPFTGLGLYQGFRGNSWLKNRVKIFETFVIPSLLAQTSKNFTVWIAWRQEEKQNRTVQEFQKRLSLIKELKFIHTFSGCPFYDDKYEDSVARERLINNLHYTMGDLYDAIGEVEYVIMTIQSSDDVYDKHAVETLQWMFSHENYLAIGFAKGYIMNYLSGEVAEYNPLTNPPFYTIKFTREQFTNPLKHIEHCALKEDEGKYKKGCSLPSHEYLKNVFGDKYLSIDERGFMVGTHSDNISTSFDIPYRGEMVSREILKDFGIENVGNFILPFSLRRVIFQKLPYKVKRKLRFLGTEKRWILKPFFSIIYYILRA